PNPMKDANRDSKSFGHGRGYLYPHAYRDHWVEQQYLPGSLQGQVFYQPSSQGYEDSIRQQVAQRREAQLAALVEGEVGLPEVLSFSPANQAQDRWLQRAMGELGEQLRGVCDHVFTQLMPQRHHVILDLNASSGLLTWEAVRQVPEGGVYSCVRSSQDHAALTEQAMMLSELSRPVLLQSDLNGLAKVLAEQAPDVCFDGIIGRNALMADPDKAKAIAQIASHLSPKGRIVLAEAIPRRAQRLYALLDEGHLKPRLYQKLKTAEDSIYANSDDALVNWDETDLVREFENLSFAVTTTVEAMTTPMTVTEALLDRWFGDHSRYLAHLGKGLTPEELQTVRRAFVKQLRHQTITWQRWILFLVASMGV
ncbi:MAG: AAA family ATPase, partial [Cyanobacteria bacterium P01_A01_bin.114]